MAVTIFFFANFGFFFLIMQYCQEVMGYSPLGTALALTPLFVPMFVLAMLSFWYLPKLGLRLVLFTGLLLVAIGIFFMRTLELGATYFDFAWPIAVMSVGIGLCTASATSAIMNATPDAKQGVASAVNDTTREVGAALGIAVAGSILAAHYADVVTPKLGDVSRAAARARRLSRWRKRSRCPNTLGRKGIGSPTSHGPRSSTPCTRLRSRWHSASRSGRCWSACGHRVATASSCRWCAGSVPG